MMTRPEAFKQLEQIYEAMPATACKKTSCATWCCTKLESFVDKEGNFMPLPLVYGVEYVNILQFLEKAFGKEWYSRFDFSKKTRTCPFKKTDDHQCLIYPVRPFTCRVYGRSVPPVFWGIQISPEEAEIIRCENMEVTEPEKIPHFNEVYPQMWTKLAELSMEISPFTEKQKQIFESNGVQIMVLAFGEFFFLAHQTAKWLAQDFQAYWKIMGSKL
ncbi:MAG: hypothetical protein JW774_04380 [Candidatus Aureabacteria bacterium]|nr:hypothetical protein [Candidatus Auribacterota bacterium]